MVRTYIRKSSRALGYTKQDLQQASSDVLSGKLTYTAASKHYNIPRPTIYAHCKGSRGLKSNTMGRTTILSPDIEKRLSDSLKTMEKYGYGLSRREVLNLVGDYLKVNKIKNSFKNGIPGEDWWLGFAKRHNLSIKKPQIVEYSRKRACDPFIIYNYFDTLKKTILELKLENKPDRIWNLDETSFCLDPSKTKCVGAKGVASTRTTFGSGRENTSILMTYYFDGKNIWDKWIGDKTLFPGTTFAATNNGWMEKEVFINYFEKSFIKTTNPSEINPVLLIYDGHSSHIDIKLVEIAKQNNITILLLPPHSSHLLQPMDLTVFKSIKTTWDQRLCSWTRNHKQQKLPKQELSKIICDIWIQLDKNIIINGFKKSGIYPFNSMVIDRTQFDPLSLKRWDDTHQQKVSESNDIEKCKASTSQLHIIEEQTMSNLIENTIDSVSSSYSFEELLLNTMKQSADNHKTGSKRKVGYGSTVITTDEAMKILKDNDEKNKEKERLKNEKRKKINHPPHKKEMKKKVVIKSKKLVYNSSSDTEEEYIDNNDNIDYELIYKIGDNVIVKYEGEYFPGVINDTGTNSALVSVMVKDGKGWNWPVEDDEIWYKYENVIQLIKPPKLSIEDEVFLVPEIENLRK